MSAGLDRRTQVHHVHPGRVIGPEEVVADQAAGLDHRIGRALGTVPDERTPRDHGRGLRRALGLSRAAKIDPSPVDLTGVTSPGAATAARCHAAPVHVRPIGAPDLAATSGGEGHRASHRAT